MLGNLQPGKYVVAVSSGVDSIVLLHLLHRQPSVELVIAHLDHGIRPDSAQDAVFVEKLAEQYGLPFFSKRAELGPHASEAEARTVRYAFLHEVREQSNSQAIVTAHHQDDLIETALLNVVRGTKRKGLVSLKSTDLIKRPLLDATKEQIRQYAQEHKLDWREDSTNAQDIYTRNKIRKIIKEKLTPEKRQKIIGLLGRVDSDNTQIESLINTVLGTYQSNEIDKILLNKMQLAEAYELAAVWLRNNGVNFDEQAIKRLVIGARTLQNKAQIDIQGNYFCRLERTKVVLESR